jgi:hypothetical protein
LCLVSALAACCLSVVAVHPVSAHPRPRLSLSRSSLRPCSPVLDPVRANQTRSPALGLLPASASAGVLLVLLVRAHLLVAYCLLQLIHGLDEGARGAKSFRRKEKAISKEPLAAGFICRTRSRQNLPSQRASRSQPRCATDMGLTNLYLPLSMS